VLLDEIEKAHPEAFNMLLQIMEDGYLSDAKGRRVDFRNTLLLMTSNIGAKLIQGAKGLGFAITREDEERENEYEAMKAKVMDALKKTFRPEFINRLDGIMVFRSLSRDEIAQIVELELRPLRLQMAEQEMKLELTPAPAWPSPRLATTRNTAPARCAASSRTRSRTRSARGCWPRSTCPATRSRWITAKRDRETAMAARSSFST
jgi:DNA-binding TFAR19-related protein (PDSD5 family)